MTAIQRRANLRVRLRRIFVGAILVVIGVRSWRLAWTFAVFRIRAATNRNAYGSVTVNHYYAVLQKNGKTQFIFDPPQAQTCVNALFPHAGCRLLVFEPASGPADRYLENNDTRLPNPRARHACDRASGISGERNSCSKQECVRHVDAFGCALRCMSLLWRWLRLRCGPVRRAAAEGLSLPAGRMDLRSPGRLARPTSAFSMGICWPRRSPTPLRPSSCSTRTRRSAIGNFSAPRARQMLWPHIDAEYQQELQGIADGVKAHGVDLDVYDIVALNAFEEVPDYYVPWLNKQQKIGEASQAESARELQRIHRHRQHDERSSDRDRAQ